MGFRRGIDVYVYFIHGHHVMRKINKNNSGNPLFSTILVFACLLVLTKLDRFIITLT